MRGTEGPALARELDRVVLEERRRAARALLGRPLLTADGRQADDFVLVRKHADWLRDWFWRHPAWRLEVTSELARLRKTPATLEDGSRPAREPRDGQPFSRRRYVLLCLILAALERSDRQTTLGKLAEGALRLGAGIAELDAEGMTIDIDRRDQRRDLVQVVRLLLDLQILERLDGDELHFLDRRGDALYHIRRPLLAALLDIRRSPSTIDSEDFEERLGLLTEEPLPDSAEGFNRRRRSRLSRQLLDDPVLFYDELDADELAYLQSQRPALVRSIRQATGLYAEIRDEGIAMVDERGHLTDLGLPEQGTKGHLTLLLAEHLAHRARRRPRDPQMGRAALQQHVAELIEEHAHHWAKLVREPGAAARLTDETIERLAALGLLRIQADGVVPTAAIGRFALGELREPEAP